MYKAGLKNALKFSSRIWDTYVYSGTPLVRPSLLHQESGLSRGVASRQG